ncbi:MAG: efflux RND transporter periplasmic adaptor subunit, partial [Cyanobacteria bacterium REEB65]|nr:efflux RND transporter periplasmic adaptor subunit [Cyanobacteria bacterium REEB65]
MIPGTNQQFRICAAIAAALGLNLAGCHRLSHQRAASNPPLATGPSPSRVDPVVTLGLDQVVQAQVATAPVQVEAMSSALDVPGQIAYDQARMAHLTAWVAGRLDDLKVSKVGDRVRRGQPVARIYSPELYADQQDYRAALTTAHRVAGSPYPEVANGARQLLEASRQRLLLLGLTSQQIASFATTQKLDPELTIRSAVQGVVIKKWVQLGQYVKTGDPLFDVVDLSRVWAEAAVPESAIGQVRVGDGARVQLAAYPGEAFDGRVSLLYPTLDPTTRTMRVRIALDNAAGLLRPQMFATVQLWGPARRHLVVPASAVVDTGQHRWVWVQVGPSAFSPRQVVLGSESQGYCPVVSGLSAGEVVVVSGGFLLDSSARLQGLMP